MPKVSVEDRSAHPSLFTRYPWLVPTWTWTLVTAAVIFSWLGLQYDEGFTKELLEALGWWGVPLAPFLLMAPMFLLFFTLLLDDPLVTPVTLIASALCFLAAFSDRLLRLPDYRFIHLYVTLAAIGLCIREYRVRRFEFLFWSMAGIALIHFPLLRWGIDREDWERINVATGIAFTVVAVRAFRGKSG